MEDAAPKPAPASSPGTVTGAPGSAGPTLRLRAPTPRVAVVIGAAIIAGVILFAAGSAIRPFVVGLLLAYLLDPLVERFARRGVARWLAVLLVFAIVIGIIALAVAIAIPPLVRQIATFTDELPAILQSIQYQLDHLTELYDRFGLPAELRSARRYDRGRGARRGPPPRHQLPPAAHRQRRVVHHARSSAI